VLESIWLVAVIPSSISGRLEGRGVGLIKIQHCVSFAVQKPDDFRLVTDFRDKVKRPGSVKLHRAGAFDTSGIRDVEDGESGALTLFDIEKRAAIVGVVEEHRLAGLPR
jgi:hypothetical protein